MKIIIDGDACPSIPKIESIGKEYGVSVKIFCDISHYITSDYSEVVIVDSGFQSVDMHVVNNAKKGDVIVTQDYGVAALCLPKETYVISPIGRIYTNDNIDILLEQRHISYKLRKSGGRFKGNKKRTAKDDERLLKNLRHLIEKSLNE